MRQPYQLSMALRYLRPRTQSSFISFISRVSIIGIAVAVAVLIVVMSVINGFYNELQQRTLGMVSDATISGFGGTLDDWRAVRERAVARPDVVDAAPYVEGEGMVFANDTLLGVRVRGIDPALESHVSELANVLSSGTSEALRDGSYRIVIGAQLAQELGVALGDEIVLFLAQATMTPFGALPRQKLFEIAGIFDSGMYEYDRGLVFTSFADASRLFRTGGRATGLQLAVTDIYEADRVARELALELGGGFYVSDWSRQHAVFFRSIQLSKTILAIILSLVICVAAFNIVSTLVMAVRDKRGDIAILRSFGTPPGGILALFAAQGVLIGLIGTALGVALGLLITTQLGALVHVVETLLDTDLFSGEVYKINDLPTQIRYLEVGQIALLALGLAALATIYPAISAARQPPAEALRYE
jgi:lipoprotein-releasing system permease protein